jgi:anti-sigma B factor antagonist
MSATRHAGRRRAAESHRPRPAPMAPSQGLSLAKQDLGGTCRIQVSGEIDMATVQPLDQLLTAATSDGARHVVVDLSQVAFLDSNGIQLLVLADRRMQRRDGRLEIVVRDPHMFRVFVVTGLDRRLNIVRSTG